MIQETSRATFRDPDGSLSIVGDCVLRTIAPGAREHVLEFLGSTFCRRAQQRGDLIGATIVAEEASGPLRLRHPHIAVPVYPWEWTPNQWLAAAELTLNLCEESLAAGYILKDATPLNILFVDARPVFVDILSFERRNPSSPLWVAYGQYIRTFLLPLIASRMLAWPLALTLFKRDGYEPQDLYAAMNPLQRLSRDAFGLITLPTLLDAAQKKRAGGTSAAKSVAGHDPAIAVQVVKRTLNDLRRRTRRALPAVSRSNWSEYPAHLSHYTAEESADKLAWVTEALQTTRPATALDVGANTGDFSVLAAAMGIQVTALERDTAAADRLFCTARDRRSSIQTIQADLARPTPAVGWENSECAGLIARLEGRFDLVMILAVVHHLILMEQIPIPDILALLHRITRRHLILEWVPPADPMFQALMRGRDTLYQHLGEADLLAACADRFRSVARHPLANGRVMFLMEKIV